MSLLRLSLLNKRALLRWLNVLLPLLLVVLLAYARVLDPGAFFGKLQRSVIDLYSLTGLDVPERGDNQQIPIHLIEIDEASLKAYGQWPWSRETMANILIRLYEKGVTVVGLDVLLVEPDRLSPSRYLEAYKDRGVDPDAFKNAYGYLDHDEFLADLLGQTPTVLAVAGAQEKGRLPEPGVGFAFVGAGIERIPSLEGLLVPTEALLTASPTLGHIAVFTDVDGMLRKIPALVRIEEQIYPSLFVSLLAKVQGATTVMVKAAAGDPDALETLRVGQIEFPVDEQGHLRLLPSSVLERDPGLSLTDVIDGKHDALLPGSVVILGPTALGLMDFHDVPGGLSVPGPTIHVAALEQVFSGKFLYRNDVIVGVEWVSAGALAILFVALVIWLNGLWSSLLFVLVMSGYVFSGFWAFSNHGVAFDWSLGMAFALVAFLATLSIQLLRTEGERGQIRKAFSTYLSPDLVAELSKNPEKLKLGGERKDLTILFADIRGFTAMSERYIDRPEELTALLNDLLTPLTDQIIDRKGTIDKYMGDAIMAFWNAPLNVDRPANQACEAALAMLLALDVLNDEFRAEGRIVDPLRIGIGINAGSVTVGNLGSHQRFDYSCLGDPVNLASRLEGLSKAYGVPIILGQAVIERLEGGITGGDVVLLDVVKVVGKQIPEEIYGLIPQREGVQPSWCVLHRETFAAIRQQDWDNATIILRELMQLNDYPAPLLEQLQWRLETRSWDARQMDKK